MLWYGYPYHNSLNFIPQAVNVALLLPGDNSIIKLENVITKGIDTVQYSCLFVIFLTC